VIQSDGCREERGKVGGKPKIGAVIAAAGALAMIGAGSATGAPPTLKPAQHVCENSGGNFIPHLDEGYFHCEGGSLPYLAFVRGQHLCERAYRGTFLIRPSGYLCTLP
jgi:hypothetical protein